MSNNLIINQQLDTFTILKDLITADSTLKEKFSHKNVLEFEPNLKSINSKSLPYIVLNVPNLEPEHIVMDNSVTEKEIEVNIVMVIDYVARDNFRKYANALINVIESNVTTLEAKGYYDNLISFEGTTIELIDQQQVVSGTFTLRLMGTVSR